MKKLIFAFGMFLFFLGASMGESENLWVPLVPMIAGGTIIFRSKYFKELREEEKNDSESF